MANDPPKQTMLPPQDRLSMQIAEVRSLFVGSVRGIEEKLARIEGNLDVQKNQIVNVQRQVDSVHEWKAEVAERLRNNSQRAAAISSSDLEQDARLTVQIQRTDTLEQAILETRKIVAEQSDFMQIGKKGIKWFGSKAGRTALTQAAIAVTIAYNILQKAGIFK